MKIGLKCLAAAMVCLFLPVAAVWGGPFSDDAIQTNQDPVSIGTSAGSSPPPSGSQKIPISGIVYPSGTGLPVTDLKAQLQEQYGIEARDGSGTWSSRECERLLKLFPVLPENFRSCTSTIVRGKVHPKGTKILGCVNMQENQDVVHIFDSGMADMQANVLHEMTHCFEARNPKIMKAWAKTFWERKYWIFGDWRVKKGGEKPPTQYGYVNAQEDMADSVKLYVFQPEWFKQACPVRYEFIRKNVFGGREYTTS